MVAGTGAGAYAIGCERRATRGSARVGGTSVAARGTVRGTAGASMARVRSGDAATADASPTVDGPATGRGAGAWRASTAATADAPSVARLCTRSATGAEVG